MANKILSIIWITDQHWSYYYLLIGFLLLIICFLLYRLRQLKKNIGKEQDYYHSLFDILDNLPFPIMVKDIQDSFRYYYWNKESELQSGIKREEAIGCTDYEIYGEERGRKYRDVDESLVQADKIYRAEESYSTVDGAVHDTIAVKSIIKWKEKKKWLLVTRWDITRLKTYERELIAAKEELEKIRLSAPGQVCTQTIDVTREDAPFSLEQLITKMGGMDVFLLSSGIGKQNLSLQPDIELQTAATNVSGFIRMVNAAYHYFEQRGKGHIAVISSIAGTKGLGSAPAYSATKRFQNTYIDALDQLAHMKKLNISFTDIRPGFVATPLLKDDKYPLLMHTSQVASQIVKAISRRKRVAIIDWRYQFIVFFWKLIPGWLWVRLPVRNQ